MKYLMFVIFSLTSAIASAELASKQDYFTEANQSENGPSVEERFVALYNSEISKKSSNLYLALAGFASKNEMAFDSAMTEEEIGTMYVELTTFIPASSGKGSCCSYQNTSLIPIWGSFKGSGAIEEIIGFLKVTFYTESESDDSYTEKLSIESILPFSPNEAM